MATQAVASTGRYLLASDTGITWTQAYDTNGTVNDIAYGGGRWVAVGTNDPGSGSSGTPTSWTSTDGITWTAGSFSGNPPRAVAYCPGSGGGGFFACCSSTAIYVGSNGTTWSNTWTTGTGTESLFQIAAGGSNGTTVVALGGNGYAVVSGSGGSGFQVLQPFGNTNLRFLGWDGLRFVAVTTASPGATHSSTDGYTWTARSSLGTAGSLLWGNASGRIIANPTSGALRYSDDGGGTWNSGAAVGAYQNRGCYLGPRLVLLGSAGIATTDSPSTAAVQRSSVGSSYVAGNPSAVLNSAPAAATLTTPAAGSSVDRSQPITLAWVFNDADAGDSQSKSDVQYKLTSASTWTTILGATTVATSYALPANQAAGNYEWQVRTYDALGVASPWSSSSFFTAATPPTNPTITAPANGGTVATSSYAVTWSAPQQDAYEVRRVADNAGSPNAATVYFTTGAVEDNLGRTRALAFDTNNRNEHVQVRVRFSGIWSAWASSRVLVSYTPPASPTVVLTPQNDTASMLVAITNPTPSGNQPAVASHDILIDDGLGEGLTRRVTGWTPGAAYTYWLARSDWDYAGKITVVAVATNGTTSTGTAT